MNSTATIATTFKTAFDAEKRAREAAEQFHRDHVIPVYRAEEAGEATFEASCAAEEAYGEYTTAHFEALRVMLETPASTMNDVIYKLETACDDTYFDSSDSSYRALRQIAADIRRLGGDA